MTAAVHHSPAAPPRRITMEQYRALPEGPPFCEFEKGRLVLMPSPTSRHQDILFELTRALKDATRAQQLGQVFMEVDVYLPDEERGYIPDISYISTSRLHLHHPGDLKIHGAPDLVVEVVSSEPERDRVEKFRACFENGVAWYWIVDPDDLSIEEYHATPDGYVRTSSVMPGEDFQPKLFVGLQINLVKALAPAPQPHEGQQPK